MLSVFSIFIVFLLSFFFFFNDTATTEIYTLSLHDALPICQRKRSTRASWRMSRLGGRSGMLSICRATSVQPFFECRNPVPYRKAGTGSEVHLAADIGGGDQFRPA